MINTPKELSDIEVGLYKSGYGFCEKLVKEEHITIAAAVEKTAAKFGGLNMISGKRFVKGKLHLMSHGYLNFVLMSVLPSLWHNKVSYAIINYLEDKFIVTGGEGCRVGKLSGAKSIPPRSFSKRTFKNLFWICCGCWKDLCHAGSSPSGSKKRDRYCRWLY